MAEDGFEHGVPVTPMLARHDGGKPWHLRLLTKDESLAPTLPAGSMAVVDCTERCLIDGELYAIRQDENVELWLWHEGFAGQGRVFGGRVAGTLSSMAGDFRFIGPIEPKELHVVGRVVGAAGIADIQAEPVLLWAREREALIEALGRIRAERRRAQDMAEHLGEPGAVVSGHAPGEIRQRMQSFLRDNGAMQRFALLQQAEALTSRLQRLEERMAAEPTSSLAGIQCKLQLVWSLHYSDLSEEDGGLERAAIGTALRAINGLTREDRPSSMGASATPLRIVPSPRRQG